MAERNDLPEKQLSTAAALIIKAQATPFPAERESLAMRAYTQLASYLNSLDPESGANGRRRERRFLRDRRVGRPKPSQGSVSSEISSKRGTSSYQSAASRRPVVGVYIDVEV